MNDSIQMHPTDYRMGTDHRQNRINAGVLLRADLHYFISTSSGMYVHFFPSSGICSVGKLCANGPLRNCTLLTGSTP